MIAGMWAPSSRKQREILVGVAVDDEKVGMGAGHELAELAPGAGRSRR